MKYIKTYENNSEPKVDDWVVAYRPYMKNHDDENLIVNLEGIDHFDFVIDIGIISADHNKHWSVIFPNCRYVRAKRHILYKSKNKKEAEEYFQMYINQIKYNL